MDPEASSLKRVLEKPSLFASVLAVGKHPLFVLPALLDDGPLRHELLVGTFSIRADIVLSVRNFGALAVRPD